MSEAVGVTAVLAGSRQQFEQFIRERGIDPRAAVYVSELSDALGGKFSAVHCVGTWHENRNARDLEMAVRARIR